MVGEVKDDGVKPFDEFACLCSPLFKRAFEVVMYGMLTPRCAGTTQVFQRNISMLCTGFDGHMDAVFSEDTLDVQRKSTASNPRFKHRIVGAETEFGQEKTSVLTPNGLGSSNHAFAQFRKTNRHPLQFLLPDNDGLADGDGMKCLVRIKHAEALDLLLLVDQFNNVGFPVFLNEDGPFS